jgi:Ser/Thr protein kinase RdoA (MazF antagonist)
MVPEERAAQAFAVGGAVREVRPHGRGLINDTFLVAFSGGHAARAILQRINRRVFPDPGRIMENLRVLLDHVARRQQNTTGRDLRFPAILPARDGRDYFVDDAGDFWRALSYLEDTRPLDTLRDPHTAGEIGYALGRFHELTRDIDTRRLHLTRPGFHVTPRYFERFEEACARRAGAADAELEDSLAFAAARRSIVSALEDARRAGTLPPRVVHGDPKLDNVLFDESGRHAVSLVDLDTVQPGLLLTDLGDCLRSCCNPAGESPSDPAEARFDLELCRALLDRYFAETRGLLGAGELRLLPLAIRLIPFELGLRFLTDHLEGDRYFKIDRPGHNLWRARTQFRLVASIEQQAGDIEDLIHAGRPI